MGTWTLKRILAGNQILSIPHCGFCMTSHWVASVLGELAMFAQEDLVVMKILQIGAIKELSPPFRPSNKRSALKLTL